MRNGVTLERHWSILRAMNEWPNSPMSSEPLPARSGNGPGGSEIAELQMKVERLLMVTEALWTILKEKHGLEDQDLLRQIVQIDLRDGRMDGKVASTPPKPCPKCERMVAKHSVRCMYCGEPLLVDPFAR